MGVLVRGRDIDIVTLKSRRQLLGEGRIFLGGLRKIIWTNDLDPNMSIGMRTDGEACTMDGKAVNIHTLSAMQSDFATFPVSSSQLIFYTFKKKR